MYMRGREGRRGEREKEKEKERAIDMRRSSANFLYVHA